MCIWKTDASKSRDTDSVKHLPRKSKVVTYWRFVVQQQQQQQKVSLRALRLVFKRDADSSVPSEGHEWNPPPPFGPFFHRELHRTVSPLQLVWYWRGRGRHCRYIKPSCISAWLQRVPCASGWDAGGPGTWGWERTDQTSTITLWNRPSNQICV